MSGTVFKKLVEALKKKKGLLLKMILLKINVYYDVDKKFEISFILHKGESKRELQQLWL